MAKHVDVQIEALMAVIIRRLGDGVPPSSAPGLCRDWLQEFRDTMALPQAKPIEATYRAHPFRGRAPREGEASYPLFALWRTKDDWLWFTNDTDQNTTTANFMWVLPADEDTERVWPLFERFTFNLRRVLENSPEDPDDYAMLVTAGGLDEYAVELKTEMGYQGPANQLIYPTLMGSFVFRHTWERTPENLGLNLPRFAEAYINYLLKGRLANGASDPNADGDRDPRINPYLVSIAKPRP